MSEEELIRDADDYEPTPDEVEEAETPRRSLWGLIAIITVVVIIIMLMQLRDRGGNSSTAAYQRAGKRIEAVKDHDAVEGAVSLWIAEGTDLGAVLAEAGLVASGRIELDGERWVINVPAGTEKAAIKKLSAVRGVYDAGRVYER